MISTDLFCRAIRTVTNEARRTLSRQAARFVIVGILNTAGTLLLYEALLLWIPYPVAYTVSFAVGLVVALFGNARFALGVDITVKRGLRFVAVYLVNYVAGLGFVALLVDVVGVPASLAPLGALAFTVPIGFLGTRLALLCH
jgi:putative flippase GtrA